MTYANQRDHELLDRHTIKETLLALTRCRVLASPTTCTFAEHLEALKQQAGSDLERQWLDYIARRGLHLPSDAQKFITKVGTRPDFLYDKQRVAIYVDGPPHDFPDRQQRDQAITTKMEDAGFVVVRFAHTADWVPIIAEHPNLFGKPQAIQTGTLNEPEMSVTGSSGVEP
jgi:very-short-patch-repair endonuclease